MGRVSRRAKARPGTTTAAAEEIARFSAMAAEWWDADGKFAPLHSLNPTRIAFIRDEVARHCGRDPLSERPFSGLGLLDIGCGGGLLSEPMCRLGARVLGIDAALESIEVAVRHAEQSGLAIGYRRALPEQLAKRGRRFDVVLNMEVVEHVADVHAFLEASAALVKPGGAMVVSTLNRTAKAFVFAKLGAEYLLRWLPVGSHDWRKFVRPSELAQGLRPHGLAITKLRGMSYNPLAGAWSLTGDLAVNYLAFAVKESSGKSRQSSRRGSGGIR